MKRNVTVQGAIIGAILALTMIVVAESASANNYFWNNAAGGVFSTGTNWTPNGSPGSGDTVNLNLVGSYQVDFTGTASTADALFQAGGAGAAVTLALAGNSWTSDRVLAGHGVSGNTLAISGGTLTAKYHFAAGAGGGSANTLTVSGAASALTVTNYDLGLGYYVDGGNYGNSNTMTISAGGTVVAGRTFYLGAGPATGNTVTVTGTNSKLQANSTLEIGGTGNSLRAENGGLVSANSWLGGTANSVVIDNATWSGASYLYLGGDLNTATVQNGGAMTAGDVRVGHTGIGGNTLTITGGTVTGTGHFCLGTNGSAGNTVIVSGASSLLKTNSFDVAVGSYGGGGGGGDNNLLRVENGGQGSVARTLYAGGDTTAGNKVLVTGTGSAVQAQYVDVRGTGGNNQVTAAAGGTLTATQNIDLRGSGNAIVVDGGTLTGTGSLTVQGANNALTARNAGVLTAGNVWLGSSGLTTSGASLNVESGAVVTGSGHVALGYGGATGTAVTVTGAGSLLKTNSYDLGVGNYNGQSGSTANNTSVTVSAGGELRAARDLFIGAGATTGNQVTATGSGSKVTAISTSITIGGSGGNNGLTVQSGGSANAPVVILGGTGNTLNADNGALTGIYLYTRGTNNTMTVSNGGTVTFGQINVGDGGSGGALNVTGGTVTSNGHFYLGSSSGTGGSVNVTGPTALVKTNLYDFYVGETGTNNTMTVSGGGTAISPRITYVGKEAAATGNRLIVTGAGSVYQNGGVQPWAELIYVGNGTAGNNTVQVSNGGILDNIGIVVGAAAGNAVTNTGGTYQFRNGNPTLTPGAGGISLTDGTIAFKGIVDINVHYNEVGIGNLQNITFAGNNTFMMNNSYSQGYTNQTYTYDSVANTGNPRNYQRLVMVNGTTAIPLGNVTIGNGGAMLADNTAASIGQSLTNRGALTVDSDATLTVGTFAQNAGSVTVNGTLASGNPVSISGGLLTGSGTISAPSLAVSNATVSIGNGPGTLTVSGAYSQASSVALLVELAGLTQGVSYDWLNVGGAATLAGMLSVSATTSPWFLDYGQTFTVLTAAGGITNNGLVLGGPNANWFAMNVGPNNVALTSMIPEPTTALLLLAGILAGWRRRPARS